jgi:hypothetical protein
MHTNAVIRPLLFFAALLAAPAAFAENNVLFIFDGSGSMKQMAGSDSRIAIAKKAMAQALSDVPKETRLGLLMYGHRRAKDCTDIELVAPIGADDAATINRRIQAVDAKGETPIAEALRQAARSFAALKGQSNSIVLVTDGIEECRGDPCAAAREIKASGFDIKAHVVGFTLTDQQRKLVQCIPDITGGKYFEARDASGLNRALGEVKQQTAAAPPPPPSSGLRQIPGTDNLLHPAAGGRLLVAPGEQFIGLADGKPDRVSFPAGSEPVWAFKDGKPATFEALEVQVPAAAGFNHKDIELLVSDDGPLGTFRSLGELTVQNTISAGGGWQRFAFPPVTARFLKIKFKTNYGGGYSYIGAYELKVVGKIDEAATGYPKPGTPEGVDLLATANGGTLVLSPNAEWQKLTNGSPVADIKATYDGDGVWQFKDGKPATFNRIDVLVTAANQYNLKDFEVLAGDEGPRGTFRSLGTFSAIDARMVETGGWQSFALPSTTARFVKVTFKTGHNSYIAGRGLRLYGKVDEAAAAAAAPPPPPGTDLIAVANGGLALAWSQDSIKGLNDNTGARASMRNGAEGVWAFKDEKPATLSAVELRIPAREQYNVKDFEVLVSTDAPTGPFKSVGTFTTVNAVYATTPWQTFTLPPTPARYVKVVFKSPWGGGYVASYGLRILGVPSP